MEGEGEQLSTKVVDRGEWVRARVAAAAEGSREEGWLCAQHGEALPSKDSLASVFPFKGKYKRDRIINKSLFVCLLLHWVTPGLEVKTQVPGLPVTSLKTFSSMFSLWLSFLIC